MCVCGSQRKVRNEIYQIDYFLHHQNYCCFFLLPNHLAYYKYLITLANKDHHNLNSINRGQLATCHQNEAVDFPAFFLDDLVAAL